MYSIIRKQSHKKTAITTVNNHNMRLSIEENIDPKKSHLNRLLIGSDNTRKDIMGYIEANDIKIRNKDTIVFNEFILTASPEFFFDKNGKRKSRSEYKSDLDDWIKTQIEYLNKSEYGICVNAVLHLDESTPHIHAIVLPIKDGKLNNKSFWRGKNSYSRLIDSYNKANKKYGLKRGEKAEETLITHTTLKEYREIIKQDIAEEKEFFNELSANILNVPERKNIIGLEKKYSAEEVKEIATNTFKKLNRQRRRAKFRAKKAEEKSKAATSQYHKKRNETSKLEYINNQLEEKMADLSETNMTLKNENISLKNDVSVFEMLKRILPEELSSLIKRAKDITTYKAPSKNELSNKIAELSKANDITDKNENTIGKGFKLK
ncbi:TPA: plasmid recombination protein [Salmonella enterica]|nr:plasmid recombination enzyme family protein [Salmonella enterica]HDY3784175.1 plasmid recombination protein [Salmonella enterica]HDY3793169.1 plasmid recombination protein [Salmonella enterica]